MNRERLEAQLAELPLYGYGFVRTQDILFSERVRWICEHECAMYGKTWACPPAVGSVAKCRARALGFDEGLLIATATEVSDITDLEATLATRGAHEEVTRQVLELVRAQAREAMALSTEACAICETCSYPDAPCRHPERMFPCVESYGIVVTELAALAGVDFYAEGNVVTWFSLILYR